MLFDVVRRLLICLWELDGHSGILFDCVTRILTGCRSCSADRQRRMKICKGEENFEQRRVEVVCPLPSANAGSVMSDW